MEKEKLKKALAELPTIRAGTVAQDHQIIEGDEQGCHFKITKELLIVPFSTIVLYMLSMSGHSTSGERQGLVAQFSEILGEPSGRFRLKEAPNLDFIYWNASRIDNAHKDAEI